MMPTPIFSKRSKIHWRFALLTVLRLHRTGGLVDDEVVEALKITLQPPSSPAAASTELIEHIRSHMSDEVETRARKNHYEYTRKNAMSPLAAGIWNGKFLLDNYKRVSDYIDVEGYFIDERHGLITPWIKRRGKPYCVEIQTRFTIQYGHGVPYRTCAIAQSRHPGESRLSGWEVLSLLLLAIESYRNAPGEPFHAVRVFAVDSFSVRRLSARVPRAYIRRLLRTAKRTSANESKGNITVEQTPYFDISNDQDLAIVLAMLSEDDDNIVKESDSG